MDFRNAPIYLSSPKAGPHNCNRNYNRLMIGLRSTPQCCLASQKVKYFMFFVNRQSNKESEYLIAADACKDLNGFWFCVF